jgi:hypothetical protein
LFQQDSGLFVNKNKTIVIVVYVDDVLFFGKNKKDINSLKQRFMKIWECRDLGDSQEFLRMRIKHRKGCILVDQCDYLKKVLQRFDLQNAKAVPTPLPEGYHPMPRDCHGYTRGNPWAFKRAQEEPKRISNEGDMVQILF